MIVPPATCPQAFRTSSQMGHAFILFFSAQMRGEHTFVLGILPGPAENTVSMKSEEQLHSAL
jgi:hypothetical protein